MTDVFLEALSLTLNQLAAAAAAVTFIAGALALAAHGARLDATEPQE